MKNLKLSKETLSVLSKNEMTNVNGGRPKTTTPCTKKKNTCCRAIEDENPNVR